MTTNPDNKDACPHCGAPPGETMTDFTSCRCGTPLAAVEDWQRGQSCILDELARLCADNERLANERRESAGQNLHNVHALACVIEERDDLKKQLEVFKSNDEFRQKIGIKTLDAKWLDPDCWKGCQSLIIKAERDALKKQLDDVTEKWQAELAGNTAFARRHAIGNESWPQMCERIVAERDAALDRFNQLNSEPK